MEIAKGSQEQRETRAGVICALAIVAAVALVLGLSGWLNHLWQKEYQSFVAETNSWPVTEGRVLENSLRVEHKTRARLRGSDEQYDVGFEYFFCLSESRRCASGSPLTI